MSVNWEALGAIGEVVGAVGVIVTLVYLAAQVRHNSTVVRSSTRQAIASMQHETGLRIAENPELASMVVQWLDDQYAGSSNKEMRTHIFFRALLRAYENQYYQHEDGTFDDEMWLAYLSNMKRSFSTPSARDFWTSNQDLYGARFAKFVERELLPLTDTGSQAR